MPFASLHSLRRAVRTVPLALTGLAVLALAVAAVALAASAATRPLAGHQWQSLDPNVPHAAQHLPRADDSGPAYFLGEAGPAGALVSRWDQDGTATVMGTDTTGTALWAVSGLDAWAISPKPPAALAVAYSAEGPKVVGSGTITAYDATGKMTYSRPFKNLWVDPLCNTPTRQVWVQETATFVQTLVVRQGTRVHKLTLPKAGLVIQRSASWSGSRVVLGVSPNSETTRLHTIYWIKVDKNGMPRIAGQSRTDWFYAALSPDGSRVAVIHRGNAPNEWVAFGATHGRFLRGEDSNEITVGAQRIFVQGGFGYTSGMEGTWYWGGHSAQVLERRVRLLPSWERFFPSNPHLRHDPAIDYLASVDGTGALTVYSVGGYAWATVPGPFAMAIPVAGGRIATLAADGTLRYIANPVAGP